MPLLARPRVRSVRPLVAAAWGAFALALNAGCAGLPPAEMPGFFTPWGGTARAERAEEDWANEDDADGSGIELAGAESPADSPFYEDDKTGEEFGAGLNPFQRSRAWLNRMTGTRGEADVSAARLPEEAKRAFEAAREDYDRGEHAKAAKAFKSLSRRYADTAIEEDALFYRAEALYTDENVAPAQDAYDTLLDRYPSTRHLDVISRRQFAIARRWLGYPEGV
ncbi:MAG: outer membrane protein assembly factor BamD, partial [Planctomycetota bacterium]